MALQLLVGLGVALLLNARSAFLRGGPHGVPDARWCCRRSSSALIWKVIYTPDVSPLHRLLEFVGLPVSLADHRCLDTALWAIAFADTWQWFPFTMLMVLAALQMIPNEPLEAATHRRRRPLAALRYIDLPLHPPGAASWPACSG